MAKKITPKKEVEKKETVKKPIKKVTITKAKVEPKTEEPKLKKTPIKKVDSKIPTKQAPKKVIVKKEPEVVEEQVEVNIPIIERAGFSKTKRFKEDKYEKIASDAPKEKFSEMGRKVSEGLLEWSYYGVDGDRGYHFYLVLDNKKKK